MYFCIQEIEKKRLRKGYPKRLIAETKCVNSILVNSYRFSEECFERTIKKAFQVSLRKSYREDGRVKTKIFSLCTVDYYDVAEVCLDDQKSEDFWVGFFDRLEALGFSDEELIDKMCEKLDALVKRVTEEFQKTEEFRVYLEHRRIVEEYQRRKLCFLDEFDASSEEYDICYDVFGKLTNPEYLRRVEERSLGGWCNKEYSDSEKKILKQFYRVLSKKFHPDANNGDTAEQMQLLNQLKSDWGL